MVVSPARLGLPRARCRGACRAPAHGGCPGRCTPQGGVLQPLGSPAPSAGPGALESAAGARFPVQDPTAGTLDLWKSADAETGGRNSSATCPGDTITEPGDRTHGCPSQAWASPSQCGKDGQGLKRVWVLMAECKTCEWQGSRPHPQSPCPGKHGALAVGALHPVCDSPASTSVSSWPQFLGIHTKAASSLARLPEAAPDHPLPTQQRHGPWPYPHIPQPQIQAWERPPPPSARPVGLITSWQALKPRLRLKVAQTGHLVSEVPGERRDL